MTLNIVTDEIQHRINCSHNTCTYTEIYWQMMINDSNMQMKINKIDMRHLKNPRFNFWILLCIVKGLDHEGREYSHDSYQYNLTLPCEMNCSFFFLYAVHQVDQIA